MLRNYMIVTFRRMARQKGYTFVNITGLAAGIACSIYILLYLQFELSYDSYHPDAERVYRVASSARTKNQEANVMAACVTAVAPALKERFPEVEAAGRAGSWRQPRVRYKDNYFQEDGLYMADPGLFDVLSIPFISGDPATALNRPNGLVLTQSIAEKYFGDEDPVGKFLLLDTVAFQVTGVVKDSPRNTHLKFKMLGSMETLKTFQDFRELNHNPWNGWHCKTYIRLKDGTDAGAFEDKIRRLPHEFNDEELKKKGRENTLFLQPIGDIHLYSNLKWEAEPPGNVNYLYTFGITGLIILLIAGINFVNLSTARSVQRAGEVGIRKVAGASRPQLFRQFMSEFFLTVLIAVCAGVLIVTVTLPLFSQLIEIPFTAAELFKPEVLLYLTALLIVISLSAGIYPALYLSSFQPVTVMKGFLRKGGRGAQVRKILVVGQFAVATVLIIGMAVFHKQLGFMQNRYLGFDKEQKLVLEFNREYLNLNTYQSVKNELLAHPSVLGATFSSSVPGRWMYYWRMYPAGEEATNARAVNCFQTDYDFFKQYNIPFVTGRDFNKQLTGDRPGRAWIINEAAVDAFGWKSPEDALAKNINRPDNPVIGVVKNFHYRGLQSPIEPLMMFLMTDDFRYLTLTVSTDNLDGTMAFVEKTYRKACPGELYQFFFLNDDFNKQYQSEQRLGRLFGIFTALGIFIACLGLFALASYMAEQKTKEIGIRKVLGATVSQIVVMFSKDFIKWIIIANVIAWPLAYYASGLWLENFAYRTETGAAVFILSGIVTLFIALATVSYQSLKAAYSNPVESLRYE